MPNTAIFTSEDGERTEMERDDLEIWYLDTNPKDIWDYDRLKDEFERTPFKEIVEQYYEFEEFGGSYEIIYDPEDKDISERLMREIKYIFSDLRHMIPPEELEKFLEEISEAALV